MNKSEIETRINALQSRANSLKQELQAKYPNPSWPWPEELQEKQGELWGIGYKIVRLKALLNG